MHPPVRVTRVRAAVALLVAAAVAVGIQSSPPVRAASASGLASRVAAQRARERVLVGGIAADDAQIRRYSGSIATLRARLVTVEATVVRTRTQLAAIRAHQAAEQMRLIVLEARLRYADGALAENLVSAYEQQGPDWLTVVLNAHGFSDLLERIDFLTRIKNAEADAIASDREARTHVIGEALRLGKLQVQAQRADQAALAARRQVDALQIALVRRQLEFVHSRDRRVRKLRATAARRRLLQGELDTLVADQASAVSSTGTGAPVTSGQVLSGGGFTFPLPGGTAVGPGSWSQDQGVDIAAPGNTAELAVGSGTIVLHGIGGFGPWAPVLHLDAPIDGQSYVYYGHAGPEGELPIGTHVGAGQVLGSIGPGIVGLSTGPHLEIGFADGSGTPAPGTSGLMMSLLQGSYH